MESSLLWIVHMHPQPHPGALELSPRDPVSDRPRTLVVLTLPGNGLYLAVRGRGTRQEVISILDVHYKFATQILLDTEF